MEIVATDDCEELLSKATVKRSLSAALDTTEIALNYYELAPGDAFSNALHAHFDQEELFYVLDGTATFETDDGQVTVSGGQAVRFGRGEYQHGYNEHDERVVALAIGAPKESTDVKLACPDCGERTPPDRRSEDGGDALVYYCGNCEAELSRMT